MDRAQRKNLLRLVGIGMPAWLAARAIGSTEHAVVMSKRRDRRFCAALERAQAKARSALARLLVSGAMREWPLAILKRRTHYERRTTMRRRTVMLTLQCETVLTTRELRRLRLVEFARDGNPGVGRMTRDRRAEADCDPRVVGTVVQVQINVAQKPKALRVSR